MKTFIHTIIFGFTVAALAVSCNKADSSFPNPADRNQGRADGFFEVSLSINAPRTKSLSAGKEEQVNNVQVYVFDADNGNRLESFYNGASTVPTMRLSRGNKMFKVLVNSKADSSRVSSLQDLQSALSDFSDNTSSNFVMSGEASVSIPATTSVEITVSRLVAKVVLSKITTNFTAPVYDSLTFRLDSIYLTNVAQKCRFYDAYTPDSWGKDYALTGDSVNATVSGKVYSTEHTFYAYPNGTATPTRLVIKATLGNTTYYYPVDLGELQANKVYTVTNIEITRPGSDSEDKPVVSSEMSFSIKVAGWDAQSNNIQEIV